MKHAVPTYPAELPSLLDLPESELPEELRFVAAAKLFELGRLSPGNAAELAGLSRLVFLSRLSEVGAPATNVRDEEVEAELQAAREFAG